MLNYLKKGCYALAFAFLMLSSSVFLQAQSFNGPGFTISDGGGRVAASCSIVPVSGITSNVVVNRVSYNGFLHTFLGDLELRVYPPAAAAPPSTASSQIIASPPDGRECNLNGTYNFTSSATTTLDAASTGCTNNQVIAGGNFRTSTYGGGTNNGTATNLSALFGSLTPAQANGNWRVCAFDFLTPDGGSVVGTTINFSVVTAAAATVSGRVAASNGSPIANATIIATDSAGNSFTTVSSSFGGYQFENLAVGETYVITATHRRYQFQNPTQVLSLAESVNSLDFIVADN